MSKKQVLSEAQQRTINKITDYEWHSAYAIQESISTLNVLVRKGLMESKSGLGSFAFPANHIKFRKKRF